MTPPTTPPIMASVSSGSSTLAAVSTKRQMFNITYQLLKKCHETKILHVLQIVNFLKCHMHATISVCYSMLKLVA